MRRKLFLLALALLPAGAGPAQPYEGRFEGWTVACAEEKAGPDCRATLEAPASGARAMRVSVVREAARDSAPRLVLTLVSATAAPPRPRLAITVDGGPPVRFASGADLASGPGGEPALVDLRLSDAATRRLLPFLRRGKMLDVTVSGEGGEQIAASFTLAGFAPAAGDIDARQRRADRQDALGALIAAGRPTPSARIRDVGRGEIPEALKSQMVARDCPVWDQTERDTSFLADVSFAADVGEGRTLWAVVCASGSYNVDFVLFIEDPSKAANRFEPLLFASFLESIGWTGVDTLSNVVYDPDARQLTALDKGRGQGDCGTFGVWEWGGAAFRMIEYRSKEECDGVGDKEKFPIVFRGER